MLQGRPWKTVAARGELCVLEGVPLFDSDLLVTPPCSRAGKRLHDQPQAVLCDVSFTETDQRLSDAAAACRLIQSSAITPGVCTWL
jgi:hypothetical protein